MATTSAAAVPTTTTSAAAAPTTTTTSTSAGAALPTGFSALGCFIDNGSGGRVLPIANGTSSTNTPAQCASRCRGLGYRFSGTEYSNECYCGNVQPTTNTASSQCNMACAGDNTQFCGAGNRINIVQDLNWVQTFFARPSFQTWNLMACYVDSASARTLPNAINLGATGGPNNATIANCLSACAAAGYTYCGEEYYAECYGSNTAPSASSVAPGSSDPLAAGCSFPCRGNSTEACGGANRVLVYVNNGTSTTTATRQRRHPRNLW
ncbi:WSC-domain-containing protein [Dissoconium aciculare CBS 342.82]|uniref:WSC-domain-containing protein n=1 Tax=Dissoconium aciculare CBS 342.82 TaxID=1314786 RepID=A0A6J3MJ16_9PEZI|nr:WSC-domain-containing protein [Dissoconium aciculare CBS 342.82]KAF1827885.1 WSC-domain-containing protein [Dissoconium aciculare CBS 342.82]